MEASFVFNKMIEENMVEKRFISTKIGQKNNILKIILVEKIYPKKLGPDKCWFLRFNKKYFGQKRVLVKEKFG